MFGREKDKWMEILKDSSLPTPRSKAAQDLAHKGIVAGKTLKEWADAPPGLFEKVVRETVDPLFGLQEGDEAHPITWKVKVNYSYTPEPEREYSYKVYEIEAVTAGEAQEIAEDMFSGDRKLDRGENHEIESCEEPIPVRQ